MSKLCENIIHKASDIKFWAGIGSMSQALMLLCLVALIIATFFYVLFSGAVILHFDANLLLVLFSVVLVLAVYRLWKKQSNDKRAAAKNVSASIVESLLVLVGGVFLLVFVISVFVYH